MSRLSNNEKEAVKRLKMRLQKNLLRISELAEENKGLAAKVKQIEDNPASSKQTDDIGRSVEIVEQYYQFAKKNEAGRVFVSSAEVSNTLHKSERLSLRQIGQALRRISKGPSEIARSGKQTKRGYWVKQMVTQVKAK